MTKESILEVLKGGSDDAVTNLVDLIYSMQNKMITQQGHTDLQLSATQSRSKTWLNDPSLDAYNEDTSPDM